MGPLTAAAVDVVVGDVEMEAFVVVLWVAIAT